MFASFALFIKNCHTVNDDHAVFAVSATSAIVRKRVRPRIAGTGIVCYTGVFSVVIQRSSPVSSYNAPPQWGGALYDDTKNACVAGWYTDRKVW